MAWFKLGRALHAAHKPAEAVAPLKKGLGLLPVGHAVRAMALAQLRQSQQVTAQEAKLAAVLKGKELWAEVEMVRKKGGEEQK